MNRLKGISMHDLTPSQSFSLTPRTVDEAMRFSTMLAKSDLVPKDFIDKPANIFVAVQWGMELGLQPMQAMQSIAVINGRPSLWGDAVLALVRASDLCEYVHEEVSDTQATCRTKRKGDTQETVRIFTVDDAKKAGLWGKSGPWTNYPKRMLQMRARSWCMRDVYPDVLRGVHVAEESQDIPEKDVTPIKQDAVEQPRAKSDKPEPIEAEEIKKEPPAAEGASKANVGPSPATEGGGAPTGKPLGEGQLRIVRAKLKNAALSEADLVAKFGALEQLQFGQFDDIQAWIAERGAKVAG